MKNQHYQIAIIGGGFGGIIAALRLLQSGRRSFVIFEKASDIGGTWRDNTYPGCACDIPSNLYCLDSEPNPDWSKTYSSQAEIWAYMKKVAQKHRLEQYICFDSEIVHSEFVETEGWWRLIDRKGRESTARVVISATGPFKNPKMPTVEGLGSFLGKTLHSARWDGSYDLRGKRVALIGTGASAAQIAPAIAPEVAQLMVFQRSAAWVTDRFDGISSPLAQKIFRYFPPVQRFFREAWYQFLEFKGRAFLGDQMSLRLAKKLSLWKLQREVHDPETRRKLTPDYEPGCKRIIVSDEYLPTFNRPNVVLETDPIERITPHGLCTRDGREHHFDTLIFATGYELIETNPDIRVFGRAGRELHSEWRRNGMEAYKGTTASGFPNLFFILGPNSGLGHNSVLLIMEAQMDYALQYLSFLEKQGDPAVLDVKPVTQAVYNKIIQQRLKKMTWATGCSSWYLDEHGKNTTIYPGSVGRFRKEVKTFNPADFDLLTIPDTFEVETAQIKTVIACNQPTMPI